MLHQTFVIFDGIKKHDPGFVHIHNLWNEEEEYKKQQEENIVCVLCCGYSFQLAIVSRFSRATSKF